MSGFISQLDKQTIVEKQYLINKLKKIGDYLHYFQFNVTGMDV